ncbi:bifunctional riboflavin kinase/FAD synthetase [Caedibacter taeniospiralis]|uniref:bifunctional riboflavin kinase/FAD synthetase n=1 Tax=Caedibacter taeniospiralis TaxID=28907 RepID=UPI000C278A60|nr:bifunctional riboflavin kinase/FAD synthetase [Caedibacter taeniospiralis]
MQLLRLADLNHIKHHNTPSIVTIGNFDGMHLGHRQIIHHMQRLAQTQRARTCVVCFEPQPKEFFLKDQAPLRITPFRDKIQALKILDVDQVLCLQFNQKLASLSPEAFVKQILVDGLNAIHVIIGDDFRFGYKREGDFTLLQALGKQHGFSVESLPSYTLLGTRISSSYIRELIGRGKFNEVKAFLGRAYTLSGRVHHGDQNGRKIGFPTINIPMPTQVAASGVYVVNVHIKDKVYRGVANIGVRPTVCGKIRLLEIHIFSFAHDLYGQYVTIEFLHFVRSEQKFSSLDALKEQIVKDKQVALDWLEQHRLAINEKV